jgi:phosphate:Na+ symporter
LQPLYLDDNVLDTPDMALDRVRMELTRLGTYATQMLWKALPSVLHGSVDDLNSLSEMDDDVDHLQGEIISYLGELSQQNLLRNQTERLYDYMAVANYIENVADMVETNLTEAGHARIEAEVAFSAATQDAIRALHAKVCWSVEQALKAVDQDDLVVAQEVIDAKSEINRLSIAIDEHLAQRLTANEPNRMQVFRIESDIIENLRRIYYFAKRIAKAIVEEDMVDRRAAARELIPELAGD